MRAPDSLELKLHEVVSHHVCAKNWTWVLFKSSVQS